MRGHVIEKAGKSYRKGGAIQWHCCNWLEHSRHGTPLFFAQAGAIIMARFGPCDAKLPRIEAVEGGCLDEMHGPDTCARVIWEHCLNRKYSDCTVAQLLTSTRQILKDHVQKGGSPSCYIGICVRSPWQRAHNMPDPAANHFYSKGLLPSRLDLGRIQFRQTSRARNHRRLAE